MINTELLNKNVKIEGSVISGDSPLLPSMKLAFETFESPPAGGDPELSFYKEFLEPLGFLITEFVSDFDPELEY